MFNSRFPRNRTTFDCGDIVMTKQDHKAECDINNILAQYKKTGIITHVQSAQATYQDLPDDIDFQSALTVLHNAEAAFAALPAVVRDYFHNDPGRYLAAFNDESQRSKLEEFGFVNKRVVETPPASVDTPPAAPK